jgi:SAM-dependent methyltransferase
VNCLFSAFTLSLRSIWGQMMNQRDKLRNGFNVFIRKTARNLILDIKDLPNRNKPLIPPLKLRRIIGQSDNYMQDRTEPLKKYGNLTPNSAILDVGCGVGSLAYSLISYNNFQGRYEGFEIEKDFTDWLRKNITPKYPNYHFIYADIFNKSYNFSGKILPAEFRFPYDSSTFDIVFLNSIFTHMLPTEMEHYLSEINRVLKPEGRCLISYFLLSKERPKEIVENEIRSRFIDSGKSYWTTNLKFPEDATAYEQEYILCLYEKYKLKLAKPIAYSSYQDWVVATKSTPQLQLTL